MSNLITLTLEAWARFRDKEITYFSNLEIPSDPGRQRDPPPDLLLVEVNREIEDLRALRRSLDHQKEHLIALLQKVAYSLGSLPRIPKTYLQARPVLTLRSITS